MPERINFIRRCFKRFIRTYGYIHLYELEDPMLCRKCLQLHLEHSGTLDIPNNELFVNNFLNSIDAFMMKHIIVTFHECGMTFEYARCENCWVGTCNKLGKVENDSRIIRLCDRGNFTELINSEIVNDIHDYIPAFSYSNFRIGVDFRESKRSRHAIRRRRALKQRNHRKHYGC